MSLPLGKRNMKRTKTKEHKAKGEGESPAFSSLLIDKFIQDKFQYSALNVIHPSDLFNLIGRFQLFGYALVFSRLSD